LPLSGTFIFLAGTGFSPLVRSGTFGAAKTESDTSARQVKTTAGAAFRKEKKFADDIKVKGRKSGSIGVRQLSELP
jgi:hypothetical protein